MSSDVYSTKQRSKSRNSHHHHQQHHHHHRRRHHQRRRLNADLYDYDDDDVRDAWAKRPLSPDSLWKELQFQRYLRTRLRRSMQAKTRVVDEKGRPVTLAERIIRHKLLKGGNPEPSIEEQQGQPSTSNGNNTDEPPKEKERKKSLVNLLHQYMLQRDAENSYSSQLLEEISQAKQTLNENEYKRRMSASTREVCSSANISLGDSATHYNAKLGALQKGVTVDNDTFSHREDQTSQHEFVELDGVGEKSLDTIGKGSPKRSNVVVLQDVDIVKYIETYKNSEYLDAAGDTKSQSVTENQTLDGPSAKQEGNIYHRFETHGEKDNHIGDKYNAIAIPSDGINSKQSEYADLGGSDYSNVIPSDEIDSKESEHADLGSSDNNNVIPSDEINSEQSEHVDLSSCDKNNVIPSDEIDSKQSEHADLSSSDKNNAIPSDEINSEKSEHADLSSSDKNNAIPRGEINSEKSEHADLSSSDKNNAIPSGEINSEKSEHADLSVKIVDSVKETCKDPESIINSGEQSLNNEDVNNSEHDATLNDDVRGGESEDIDVNVDRDVSVNQTREEYEEENVKSVGNSVTEKLSSSENTSVSNEQNPTQVDNSIQNGSEHCETVVNSGDQNHINLDSGCMVNELEAKEHIMERQDYHSTKSKRSGIKPNTFLVESDHNEKISNHSLNRSDGERSKVPANIVQTESKDERKKIRCDKASSNKTSSQEYVVGNVSKRNTPVNYKNSDKKSEKDSALENSDDDITIKDKDNESVSGSKRAYQFTGFSLERAYTLPELVPADLKDIFAGHRELSNRERGQKLTLISSPKGSNTTITSHILPSLTYKSCLPLPTNQSKSNWENEEKVPKNSLKSPSVREATLSCPDIKSYDDDDDEDNTSEKQDSSEFEGYTTDEDIDDSGFLDQKGSFSPHHSRDQDLHKKNYDLLGNIFRADCKRQNAQLSFQDMPDREKRVIGLYNELKCFNLLQRSKQNITIAMASRPNGLSDLHIEWGNVDGENNNSPRRKQTKHRKTKRSHYTSKLHERLRRNNNHFKYTTPNPRTISKPHLDIQTKPHEFIYLRDLSFSHYVAKAVYENKLQKYMEHGKNRDSDVLKKRPRPRIQGPKNLNNPFKDENNTSSQNNNNNKITLPYINTSHYVSLTSSDNSLEDSNPTQNQGRINYTNNGDRERQAYDKHKQRFKLPPIHQ